MNRRISRTLVTSAVAYTIAAFAGIAAAPALAQEMGREAAIAPAKTTAAKPEAPTIQLAILLDTSGSMSGLINQARTQIWSIVNEMTRARMEGQRPQLRVSLYEYGKSSISASEGHLRQILPLTDDLDAVSAELFKLTTNGGAEYCGRVIQAATEGLSWSSDPRDLRIIVIAGNEPFTQGDLDYKTAVRGAVKKGIIVNTIHCGDEATGAASGWKDGAILGEGTYSFIDHNAAAIHIEAPQDKELAELGSKINTTYLGYGDLGQANQLRQQEQDRLAAAAGVPAAAERAAAKGGGAYQNASWDLVDAVRDGAAKLEELKDEDLPEQMQGKSLVEKKEILEQAAADRTRIQQRIAQLQTERQQFLNARLAEKGGDKTLGTALSKAMRSQAESRGYVFEKP